MELAYQWDLVEEEIPTVFEKLLQSVESRLLDLKSYIRGKFMEAAQRPREQR
jgi:hypothetical protein